MLTDTATPTTTTVPKPKLPGVALAPEVGLTGEPIPPPVPETPAVQATQAPPAVLNSPFDGPVPAGAGTGNGSRTDSPGYGITPYTGAPAVNNAPPPVPAASTAPPPVAPPAASTPAPYDVMAYVPPAPPAGSALPAGWTPPTDPNRNPYEGLTEAQINESMRQDAIRSAQQYGNTPEDQAILDQRQKDVGQQLGLIQARNDPKDADTIARLTSVIEAAKNKNYVGDSIGEYGKTHGANAPTLPAVGAAPSASPLRPMDTAIPYTGAAVNTRSSDSPLTATIDTQPATAPGLTSTLPTIGAGPNAPVSGSGNVSTTATTPENTLIAQTLARAPGIDRFKLAQDEYDTAVKAGEPAFQAMLRDANRTAAAGGALGSGKLQSSIGDVVANRANTLDTQRTGFLTDALRGSIDDQFKDVGIAQQQQGFQEGQQGTAFDQAQRQATTEEALTNGAFQRAIQQLTAGSNGNPADLLQRLSAGFSGDAKDSGNSLAALIAQLAQKNGGTQSQTDQVLKQLLQQMMQGQGSTNTSGPDYSTP